MQETHNNCFGSKIHSTSAEMLCSMTFSQAKTGKLECRNVTYISALVLNCFLLKKGRATFIQSFLKTPVCGASLLHGNEFYPELKST